jgi:hypothetical protein
MQGMTCDGDNFSCPNLISSRCNICQGSYCLRHQAQGNKRCDSCIAAKKKTGGSLMKWGCLTSLGCLLVVVITSITLGARLYTTGTTLYEIVVGGLFWIGVILFLIGAQIHGTSKG